MLRHQLLLISRNLKRHKSSFFINLIGLSTGLACAILIYLWVNDELSVDKFHEKDARIYQVLQNQENSNGILTIEQTPGLLAQSLASEMDEVEYATPVIPSNWLGAVTVGQEDAKVKALAEFVGKDYFNIFSYPLIQGNKEEVLSDPESVVISKSLAQKLFGSATEAVGKTLEWNIMTMKLDFRISGIFDDIPASSSVHYDLLFSFEKFKEFNPYLNDWGNSDPATYVLLKRGTDIKAFNRKITDYLKTKPNNPTSTLLARKYSDGYLYGTYKNGKQAGGRIEYVKLFSIIAVFVLIIACINFMNLSTARATTRMKEVGIKKSLGVHKKILIVQYLVESLLMTFISLCVALLIVFFLLQPFNQLTGKQLHLHPDASYLLAIAGITFITGIVAGIYPAFYLSGFKPVAILKGKFSPSNGETWVRKGLVVFQFSLSVILIVSVLVVYKQIELAQNKNLGLDKDNVVSIDMDGKIAENSEEFITQLKNIPGVVIATSIEGSMLGEFGKTSGISWEGKDPEEAIDFATLPVGYDIVKTAGLELVAGRDFTRDFASDRAYIIFNETAIRAMGLQDPIGKIVNMWGQNRQIAGVVKDFHFESLHEKVKPFALRLQPEHTTNVIAKIKAGTERVTLDRIEKFFQEYNPGFPFAFTFWDQDFQTQYAAEHRVSVLSRYFAGLTILISCLGLFGLAAFTAERRLKEIGIRKVLGSGDLDIISLLSGEFTKIVVTGVFIALPVSYLIAHRWLESFAYSIELKWWYFVGAGILTLLTAWFTVGMQTVKAAMINPTECLKEE